MNLVDDTCGISVLTKGINYEELTTFLALLLYSFEGADLHGASGERLMNIANEGSCLRIQILLRPALNFSR